MALNSPHGGTLVNLIPDQETARKIKTRILSIYQVGI